MDRYEGANLAWQLGGDARLVRELARDADVLLLVECRTKDGKPVDVKAILGDDWRIWQNLRNDALAGTVIALRKGGPVKFRRISHWLRLIKVNSTGHSVQARYLRTLPVRDAEGPATLLAVHLPLGSTGLQDDALRVSEDVWRATKGRKILFADCNMRPAVFADALLAPHFRAEGVMVWLWSEGWSGVRVFWRNLRGSDHLTGVFRTN